MRHFQANNRISRRTALTTLVASVTSVATPALLAQNGTEPAKISIGVGGKATLYYLPLTLAERLGYFSAEKLNVSVVNYASGALALQAGLDGLVDTCCGPFENTINLQSQGRFFRSLVLLDRAPQVALGVSTQTLPNYQTLADLRGRKIGVSTPGSSINMVASLALAQGGLSPGEVTFVGVGVGADALHALRSGQIDAICNPDPLMTLLEKKSEVRIVCDTRTLKGSNNLFGGPMPAACLYAPQTFVSNRPQTAQALSNALVRTLKWLQTAEPSDLAAAVPEAYFLGDRALFLASFDKVRDTISPDGIVSDDSPPTALRALARFDARIKPGQIDLSRVYTNTFAQKSKDRFKA